jgi:hypothetical protein
MSEDRDTAIESARRDLAQRLDIDETQVVVASTDPADFPDASLGAPVEDEMSAQVITPGWRIRLTADGKSFEYRASGRQLRLFNFEGENYRI